MPLDEPLLLEALSQRLLKQQAMDNWRSVFLSDLRCPVRFTRQRLFLLCTDAPARGWTRAELALFAQRFGGWCEPLALRAALCSFDDPAAAVRSALLLQRVGADSPLRVTLAAADCTFATVQVGDTCQRWTLSPDDAQAQDWLAQGMQGCTLLAGGLHEEVAGLLEQEAVDALVATEVDAHGAARAWITLPPPASAACSTFAGLGLAQR